MTEQPRDSRIHVVDVAQNHIRGVVGAGDVVVDATAGNGHDTAFLARLVTSAGHVLAMDSQAAAVKATEARVNAEGVARWVTIVRRSHSEPLPIDVSQIAAAMFNLGYLPGGDHSVRTETKTTIAALQQLLLLLRPGGMITVVAYRGHDGGRDEAEAVERWSQSLPAEEFVARRIESDATNPLSPILFVVRRMSTPSASGKAPIMNSDATDSESIELDRFLKLARIVSSGGEAKHLIRSGGVLVNGEPETRRGRQLRPGDVVTWEGEDYVVESDDSEN